MNILRNLFRSRKPDDDAAPATPSADLPRPDAPHFVVGDVHGCLDLLEHILEQIDSVIGELQLRDPRLVFVGDYVDRGPASAAVLGRLHELAQEFPDNVTCLLGNHEQMMLDFLEAPVARHARWFRNGADTTLASFGIDLPDEGDWSATSGEIGERLREAVGETIETWMRSLPTSVRSGNLTVVHAGIDPGRGIDDQSPRVLLWGHPEFLNTAIGGGQWVAHGHTVIDAPTAEHGRIAVDTGAHISGLLTCAVILPDGTIEFLQTTGARSEL